MVYSFSLTSSTATGPGYSDTVSVMSDLSIPTVVTNLHVPEEEYYKDLPPTPPMQSLELLKRQPSLGSHEMGAPPDREDDTTTLMAPSLITASAPPSVAAPSLVAPVEDELQHVVRAPSRRVVSPPKKGGAAAQRRQTHQAVLAHLQQQQQQPDGNTSATRVLRRSSMPTTTPSPKLRSVNDLPPYNFPHNNDESSEYNGGLRNKTGPKRRSLLSVRGNKYAASVTATSTRMLLSQQQQQKPTPTTNKRGSLLNRSKRDTSVGSSSPNSMDLDGVLSTMNGDIDFIFQELSVLEDSTTTPATAAAAPEDSNIGATAKIKYTLTSVARTLRHKEHHGGHAKKNDASLLQQNKQTKKDEMSWGSLDKQELSNTDNGVAQDNKSSDPLLIDEDGFIVSSEGSEGGFSDPFAPPPTTDPFASTTRTSKPKKSDENPFAADSFFPPSTGIKKDTKKRAKKKSTTVTSENTKRDIVYSPPGDSSVMTKESRIDAVELATKKRIEMLRKLVEYRARHVSEDSKRSNKDGDELEKLDFVEAETMKQIARLRDRLGESRRELGQE